MAKKAIVFSVVFLRETFVLLKKTEICGWQTKRKLYNEDYQLKFHKGSEKESTFWKILQRTSGAENEGLDNF